MQDNKLDLKRITEILLQSEDCYGDIKKATDDLYQLFLRITDMDVDENKNREAIYLPSGKAIGTVWAAMCINEFLRTKKFIRGFFLGIKEAQRRFPNTPIHILYAGTGPFATLAIPLTTIFSSKEISFTFIEINNESIIYLQRIIEAFGIEGYVKEIVKGDAVKYDAKSSKPFHMIITETMLNALQKEPQVAITMNLLPHMEKDGILIPENIIIEAVLLDSKRNRDRLLSMDSYEGKYFHSLGTIFELNKDIVDKDLKYDIGLSNLITFPEREVEIANDITSGYNQLSLFTTINVFKEEYLTHWQCSLNLPYNIMTIDWDKKHPQKMGFRYVISEKPGFEYTIKKYSK